VSQILLKLWYVGNLSGFFTFKFHIVLFCLKQQWQ